MHRAVGEDPLADLEPPLARHQRRREVGIEVVHMRPDLAPDLEQVAKAARRDQRDPAALPLDQRVGADGRAMRQPPHIAPSRSRRGTPRSPSTIARPGIVRRRRPLVQPDRPARLVEAIEVRERPPDVHADRPAQRLSPADPTCVSLTPAAAGGGGGRRRGPGRRSPPSPPRRRPACSRSAPRRRRSTPRAAPAAARSSPAARARPR